MWQLHHMLLPSILRCRGTSAVSAWLGTRCCCTCASSWRCLAWCTWVLLRSWLCWLSSILWWVLLWLSWCSSLPSLRHLSAKELRNVADWTKHVAHYLIHLRTSSSCRVGATGSTTTTLSWWSHKTLQKALKLWWHTWMCSSWASGSTTHSTHHLGKHASKTWRTSCLSTWWEWEPRGEAWWGSTCSSSWGSSWESWRWTSWPWPRLEARLLTWLGSAWSCCSCWWSLASCAHLSLCWLLNDVNGLHVFRYIVAKGLSVFQQFSLVE